MNKSLSRYLSCALVILTMLVAGVEAAFANQLCKTRSYGIRDGLTSQHISTITQDKNDILWVATWNGVAYFDGSKFTNFRGNNVNGQISSNRFNDILHDRNGNVWLLTFDRDITLLDVATAHFRNMRSMLPADVVDTFAAKGLANTGDHVWVIGAQGSPSARISVTGDINADAVEVIAIDDISKGSKEIRKIQAGADTREWIFTDKAICLYGSELTLSGYFIDVYDNGGSTVYIISADGKIYAYDPSDKSAAPRLLNSSSPLKSLSTSLAYDDNLILLGGVNGVAALNTTTGNITPLAASTSAPVNEIIVDSRGRIWVFTTNGSVLLYESPSSPGRILPVAPVKGTSSTINIWLEDRYGNIWLAPNGGSFCLYDESSRTLIPQIIKHNEYSTESVAPIETAYVDNQKNLWFSSNHNLTVVSFHNEDIRRATMTENDEVRAVGRLNDGTILLGTAAGHLARFNSDGRLLSFLKKSGSNGSERLTESLDKTPFSSKIYTIVEDKDHNIWIGTKGAGLHAITPSGVVKTFRYNSDDPYSIPCDTVYHLNQDKQGNLWIGTYGAGLALAKPQPDGSYRFISSRNDLKSFPRGVHDRVRRITSTPDGTIIASCTSGLLTFSNKFNDPGDIKFHVSRHIQDDSTSIAGDNVMQTLIASDGSIYVLPLGERIQKLTSTDLLQDNLKFTSPYSGDNPHSILYSTGQFGNSLSLLEDNSHNIIIVFEATIVVYDPATGNAYTLASKSLGNNVEFTEALPALDPATGRLWFGTLGSGIVVSPDNVKVSAYVPRIAFTGVHFQSEKETRSLINPSEIIVPPSERNIAISFAALDYPDNSTIQYAYRMEGQPDWTYIDNANTIYLNDLTPGIHRLYVRSTNADGIWQENAKSLDLVIKPSFGESIWARLLYLMIALIILFVALYIYTIYRKSQMMKEVHRKERAFFIEASHRLRTPLTLIGSPVAEVLETEQLSDTGRQHLARVHRNALEMLQLVNSMLKRGFDDTDNIDDENAAAYITPDSVATSFYDGNPPVTSDEVHQDEAEESAPKENAEGTTILIVEDNKDLREFLRDILRLQYNVVTANNGREGLRKAEKVQPDFIITDVTMPQMDGLTMVHNIKQNKALSHIPIIVLSAKASVNDRVQGLREGIDDYITKPFSATYLRQRIASIITQRSILQQSYFERLGREMAVIGANDDNSDTGNQPDSPTPQSPSEETADKPVETYQLNSPSITDADQEMMDRLLKYIETRIGDENLKIEELADAVNMGRTVFYGKIKALVGMSPSDFVRRLRMQRAEELIVRSKMNFSQIAYNVGFSDPKYFTKCFKKETGMTPSEYRQKSAL